MTTRLDMMVSLDLRQYSGTDPGAERFRANVLSRSPLRVVLEDGTAAGQIDAAHFAALPIGAGATVSKDLLGSVTNQIGEIVSISTLVLIAVINLETTAGRTIKWGPTASTGVSGIFGALTHRLVCPVARTAADPGLSLWYSPAGLAITSGTDDLDFTNQDATTAISNAYLLIAGRST